MEGEGHVFFLLRDHKKIRDPGAHILTERICPISSFCREEFLIKYLFIVLFLFSKDSETLGFFFLYS